MKYDLLIFDLDGTLVDSREDITAAVNFVLKKYTDKQKTVSEVSSYVGQGLFETLRHSFDDLEFEKESVLADFKKYYSQNYAKKTTLYNGVLQTLQQLETKHKVVVSNKDRVISEKILKSLDIRMFFDAVCGPGDSFKRKPDPSSAFQLLEKFDVSPSNVLMVGDMDIDVAFGKNAGLVTCAVNYGLGTRESLDLSAPDYIISEFKELLTLA